VTSRGKGNPMTDHARQVPGSTRSRRPALSRSATPARRFHTIPEKCDHYATKMLPNFKTQILINLLATTYNFEPQKWSHFPATERFPLPWGEGQGEGQTGSSFSGGSGHHPFSLGEKVGMRDRPVHSGLWRPAATYFTYTVQNRRNRRVRRFSTDPTTLYQVLTHTKIGVRRFSVEPLGVVILAESGRDVAPPASALRPFAAPLRFSWDPLPRGEGQGEGQTSSPSPFLCASLRSLRPSLRVPLETGKNRNFPEFRFPDPRPRFATLGLGSSTFIRHSALGNSSLVLRLRVFALK